MEKKIKKKESTGEVEFIENLMQVMNEKNLTELSYETKKFNITLKGSYDSNKEKQEKSEKTNENISSKNIEIPHDANSKDIISKNIGMFFYKSNDGKSNIEIGKKLKIGDYIGYILTLGVKNAINSGVSGTIAEIYIENGSAVDYGKPLIKIKIN
jgi:biotin carboxyl carrier protein